MTRVIKEVPISDKFYREIACNSDDNKPKQDYATGSLCLEADTGDIYCYDEEDDAWTKING